MDIDREKLAQLITCVKTIQAKPRKQFLEANGCRRNDFTAVSDSDDKFRIFMRQNLFLSEDFSIGLMWACPQLPDKDIILCRFNGAHGGNRKLPLHFVTHIHLLNLDTVVDGRFKENDVHATDQYATFDEAIYAFCEYCHIRDAIQYFPNAYSKPLF